MKNLKWTIVLAEDGDTVEVDVKSDYTDVRKPPVAKKSKK